MIYLAFYSCVIAILFIHQRYRFTKMAAGVMLMLAAFFVAFLSAFQYEVGADYHSYLNMVGDVAQSQIIYGKEEFAFYYFLLALDYLNLEGQWIFVIYSLICAFLVLNALQLLRRNGYQQWVIFMLLVTVTGLMHNQMNGLRNILAVYIFVNSFLYKADGKTAKSLLFLVVGAFTHQTFLGMAIFLLLPAAFYLFVFRKFILVYFFTLVVFSTGVFVDFLRLIIEKFLPFYVHYLGLPFFNEGVGVLNVMSKLYYLPLHLAFLYYLKNNFHLFTNFDKIIVGMWLLGSNVYFSLYYVSALFRLYHYVVFFGVIPLYFLFYGYRRDSFALSALFLYVTLPYFLKVLVFREGEYGYSFFGFH